MAEKLTPQQEMAVNNRGGKLLVSAAAGSGKTKVLVDRLMKYLTDDVNPANLDEFLIITYTKAAAAELRGKIAAKLSQKIAEDPENKHLQRQMQRLYLTKISTVHAFCGDILREYAYKLDLPTDFRVADENECRHLRERVMNDLLDQAYADAGENYDFRAFVDSQGLGRDDRLVPEIVLKVYDSARCHLEPDAWLDRCIQNTDMDQLADASQTLWGQFLLEDLRRYLSLQIQAMEQCASAAEQAEGMEKPAALLRDTVYQLKKLSECNTWDEVVSNGKIDYGRMVISKKCPDQELAERIKAVRAACKAGLEKKLKSFSDDSSQIFADMQQACGAVCGIVSLVRRFSREYDALKRRYRVMDFGDLEHRTLDLLLGKMRSGATAAAREIGDRFREIMVDEYQDSNAVQDAIFCVLTEKRQNCFMVGDVKQSIYQFRLADPSIFLEKHKRFAPAENAVPGKGRKVNLSSNFRSGGAILRSVNDVFRLCMSPEVGGLEYGEDEALREGIPHGLLGEPEVEFHAIAVNESTYEEESEFVAGRVEQLLDGTHYVRDGDALRPIIPEDIAILLRSPGSVGSSFCNALQRRGIRCVTGGGEDLLQTEEISTLRALLQCISNPRQDIPLLAVLVSPVFAFTADDLASFRIRKRHCTVYDALVQSKEQKKVTAFLEMLDTLRRRARTVSLCTLLEYIYALTRMDSIYAAMPNGKAKSENLKTFFTMAVDFEATGKRNLQQFLEYLDSMEEKGLVVSGEQRLQGAVTLMSIHKSKGLEFPVVFVCGLSREFNRESVRAQVLCDQNLGLGLSAVDKENRVRYPTIAKRAIAVKTVADSLSEEMRVLYVALTRARDRLIMTYASKTLEKDLAEITMCMDMSPVELMTRSVVCPGEWLLMAAMKRTEAGEFFVLGGKPSQTQPGDPAWKICVHSVTAGEESGSQTVEERPALPASEIEKIREGLQFRYSHMPATIAPSKQTATQRKNRQKDAEAAENAQPPRDRFHRWRKPGFICSQDSSAARGNAMHGAMQYIRYDVCTDLSAVKAELDRLVAEGFLTEQEKELVSAEKILAFFATELGQKLKTSSHVLREFKFSVMDPGEHYAEGLLEDILLQGVVDCALLEDDGLTVIDFKTDRVTEDTLPVVTERYRAQVQAYADALQRIFCRPVKDKYLYFFAMDKFISIE